MNWYSVSKKGLVIVAAATDFFTLYGCANKIIQPVKLRISAVATAAAPFNILVIKRSAVNTTGTSTTLTPVPLRSDMGASGATVKAYTVNPGGLGTAVGTLYAEKILVGKAATPVLDAIPLEIDFYKQSNIFLYTANEGLCLNFDGQTMAGGLVSITLSYTETWDM